MKRLLIINIIALFLLSSCMTLQRDKYVSPDEIVDDGFSLEMQSRLAVVDAAAFSGEDAKLTASVRTYIISEIEKRLAVLELEKQVAARLYALAGRTYLLSGNKEKAQKYYEEANKRNAGDSEAIVLAHRLGIQNRFENALAAHEDDGILVLESALDAYASGQYADAAARFDTAFLLLESFYRAAYSLLRDKAWNLKDTVSSDVALSKLLTLDSLTVLQMLEITQHATQLFDVYTGGKKYKGMRLFAMARDAELLKSISGMQNNAVLPDSVATRILCARFLWNMRIVATGDTLGAAKYSTRYRTRTSVASPVPDVSIESEDFDAVLGVVENELMSLKDGRNFNPQGSVSGAEFNKSIRRIK